MILAIYYEYKLYQFWYNRQKSEKRCENSHNVSESKDQRISDVGVICMKLQFCGRNNNEWYE